MLLILYFFRFFSYFLGRSQIKVGRSTETNYKIMVYFNFNLLIESIFLFIIIYFKFLFKCKRNSVYEITSMSTVYTGYGNRVL